MTEVAKTTSALDARLAVVLEEYLEALEAGTAPPRDLLLARHPELAEQLQACLASLDFIRRATIAPSMAASEGLQTSGGAHGDPNMQVGSPSALVELGDYRILRELGRGGMGIVYEALQTSLGRHVALKVLPFAAALDAKQLQRFKNEAHAAAQLHHTNIVPVFGVGCERGVYYYAMQYIEGQTLAQVVQQLRQISGMEAESEKSGMAAAGSELASDFASGRFAPPARGSSDAGAAAPATVPPRVQAAADDAPPAS